jgi:hypothetical protein
MNDGVMIVLGLAGLAVVIALVGSAIHEYRGKKLREAAEEMGFTFQAEDAGLAAELFGSGASAVRVQNVLRGQAQGLEVVVFDLLQQVRRAQYIRHVRFTLLLFRDDEAAWPTFALWPRGFLSRLGGRSGPGTSLFEEDTAFARRYQLAALRKGVDPMDVEKIAGVFTEEARRYFAEHPGMWIEGGQQKLMLSQGRVLPPRELRTFLERGFEVMNVLKGGEAGHDHRL